MSGLIQSIFYLLFC